MTKDSIDQAVEAADARDGFRVVELVRGGHHWIYLAFFNGGVMVDIPTFHTDETMAIPLWKCQDPSSTQLGEAVRIKLFGEAICRFLNSGGSWEDMQLMLESCRVNTSGMTLGFSNFGYKLLDSCINDEGRNEHMFVAAGERRVIRWVEDSFVETVPDYLCKQEWDEIGEADGRNPTRRSSGGSPGQEVSGELPGRADHRVAGQDHSGGELPASEDDAGG